MRLFNGLGMVRMRGLERDGAGEHPSPTPSPVTSWRVHGACRYFLLCGSSWVLIDAGWPKDGPSIKQAAAEGQGRARPASAGIQ
jgi:hypothetical protein